MDANKKKKLTQQTYFPTLLMLTFLGLVGLGIYIFTDREVHWFEFISMMFFYGFIFFIGSYVAGRKKGSDTATDVMLAGRSIPLWVAVFTMSATWIGGGYINGTAESAYDGASGLVWVQAPWGYALSLIIGGLFFAKKMRRYRFKTMLDPLSQRFGRKMTAVLFVPALVGEIFWTGAILAALGATFGVVLGLGSTNSILLSAIIAIAYTALGGLWAVALTDVVQMVLLLVGLFITIPFALDAVGGWNYAWTTYQERMGAQASFFPSEAGLGSYYWMWWDYALLLMFGGIPWQVYFQRVLSAKDEKTAQRLSIIAGFICLLAAIPPLVIGITAQAFDWNTIAAGPPESSKMILPHVIAYLTNPVVATIGLGAVAAAVMSSADSSILSASSMAGWNIYKPLINPQAKAKQLAKVIRRCIWIVGIAATLIAIRVDSVYNLWILCSDFVYCLLFPALATAMFDKKANFYGAAAGFTIAAILRFGGGDPTLHIPTIIPYPIIDAAAEIDPETGSRIAVLFPFRTLAMVSGLVTILVVSRLTQKWAPARQLKVATEE